jgi:hypothetical protein
LKQRVADKDKLLKILKLDETSTMPSGNDEDNKESDSCVLIVRVCLSQRTLKREMLLAFEGDQEHFSYLLPR